MLLPIKMNYVNFLLTSECEIFLSSFEALSLLKVYPPFFPPTDILFDVQMNKALEKHIVLKIENVREEFQ